MAGFIGAGIAGIVLIAACVAAIDSTVDEAVEELEWDIGGLKSGRNFMMSQPCDEVWNEFSAARFLGQEGALYHVANIYNLKTEFDTYVSPGDVLAKIEVCL